MARPLLRVPPRLSRPSLLGGLSTRVGFPAAESSDDGASRARGRETLARALGRSPDDCAWLRQVHGARVIEVTGPGLQGDGDALVSVDPRWILLVSVADCCPILLWSTGGPAFGVVHAGWRGCVAGVLGAALESLVELGAKRRELRAWLGPSIGVESFEVGSEVAEQFPSECVTQLIGGRPHVDLRGALRRQILEFGLDPTRVELSDDCTFRRSDLYWSYRRDGGIEGRHMGYLARGRLATP